jgi:hypothetical protein
MLEDAAGASSLKIVATAETLEPGCLGTVADVKPEVLCKPDSHG